jgi:LPXTG-motif cell wall-anchored protein
MTDLDMINISKRYDFFVEESDFNWWMIFGGISTLLFLGTLILLRRKKEKGPNRVSLEPAELARLIEKGESNQLEFKSSLRWDYRLKQSNKALELVIIKTISAFLNSHGGSLIIGINDDGEILGLDYDYQSIGKNGRDSFILFVTNLINKHLGKNTHRFIRIDVIELNGKEISVVLVEPSDSPVFIGKNETEEFFIRASASSQPLAMSETLEYIKSRWG